MRSVFVPVSNQQARCLAGASGGRWDARLRVTLLINAQVLALAGFAGMPLAIFLLTKGVGIAFLAAAIALCAGTVSYALIRSGHVRQAASGTTLGILGLGLVLGLADPAILDLGFAIAWLAPLHAMLVGDAMQKKLATAGAAVAAGLMLFGMPGSVDPIIQAGLAGTGFALSLGLVAVAALRSNAASAEQDRAQADAIRHLIENAQDALMRFSPDGALSFVSRSSEELFGCRRYEISSSGLTDRLHVLDRPNFLTALSAANKDGQDRRVEVRIRRDAAHAGGVPQFVWVEIALSPVTGDTAKERPFQVVALFRDISDRKHQEQEMRLARQSAEHASDAKSRFLAIIGHELRTPLNAIVGFSEMMTSGIGGELAPSHREYAELIHRSGHHLLDVIGMLLDMSKIEAGKFELQTEAFAPESLLKPSLGMVEQMARAKNIRFATEMPSDLPMLTGDERACRQILINLLSNAVKFSHAGGTVTVGLKRQGQNLVLSVADRGIGMSSEALQRLGEPFFQAQDGLTRSYEGTGLGLSIVKGLVDLHGGSMRAISEPGEGTTMTVFLPISGPAPGTGDVTSITPLRRQTITQHSTPWPDLRRKAQ